MQPAVMQPVFDRDVYNILLQIRDAMFEMLCRQTEQTETVQHIQIHLEQQMDDKLKAEFNSIRESLGI